MKQYRNRFLAGGLALCMLLGLLPGISFVPSAAAAATDPFGFTLEGKGVIEDASKKNPYGPGKVNFAPVPELNLYESAQNLESSKVFDVTVENAMQFRNNTSGGRSGTARTGISAYKNYADRTSQAELELASGVAYDPTGSGRDDHIAYYGFYNRQGDRNHCPAVLAFDATKGGNGQWPIGTKVQYVSQDQRNYGWVDNVSDDNFGGFTAITAGDFDGDGKDSLVVYDPACDKGTSGQNSMLLKESTTEGKDWREIQSVNTLTKGSFGMLANDIQKMGTTPSEVALNTAMVHLSAADLDGDQKDELLVTVSLGNLSGEKPELTARSSVLAVLKWRSNGNWEVVHTKQMSNLANKDSSNINRPDSLWFMRCASSVAGDVDGDGKMEIITAGAVSDQNSNNYDNVMNNGIIAVVTQIENDKYINATAESPTGHTGTSASYLVFWNGGDSYAGFRNYYASNAPISLACVRFDGFGTPEYVVANALPYYYDTENGQLKSVTRNVKHPNTDDFLDSCTAIRQPVVGNFDGNSQGREQVFFIQRYNSQYRLGGWRYNGQSLRLNDQENLEACLWDTSATTNSTDFACLTAPDVDTDDGMVAEFAYKEKAYTDPEIMAILEASPYFEDLKGEYYDSPGATRFGKSTGSSSGSTESASTKSGTYMSFSHEFSLFGVSIASMEMEAALEEEWSNEYSIEHSYEYGMNFTAGPDSNQVVVIRTPVIVYHYKVWDATGKQGTMEVNSPQKSVYQMLTVDDYNEAAKATGGEVIGEDIISCEPGRPSTYRQSTSGLRNAQLASENQMSVGVSSGTTELSFSSSNSENVTNTLTHSIDAKAGAGVAGITIGLSRGASTANGKSQTTTSSVTRSGEVMNLPDSARGQYGFNWNLVTWDAVFGKGADAYVAPVVSYVVQGVQEPPSLPVNFSASSGLDGKSVDLTWEPGYTAAAKYEISRYLENAPQKYFSRGTVSGDQTNFTDTLVEPGKLYKYCIRALGSNSNDASAYSEPVAVVTASAEGAPTIHEDPKDQAVPPGETAVFSVTATPASGNALTFSWQCRTKGSVKWEEVSNTGNTLTLSEVSPYMDGNEYRCMISELGSGENAAFIYSKSATLHVGKVSSQTTVSTSTPVGTANHTMQSDPKNELVPQKYKVTLAGDKEEIYLHYKNEFQTDESSIFPSKRDDSIYYCQNDGEYYVLDQLTPNASAANSDTVTAEYETKTLLTNLNDCLFSGSKETLKFVASVDALRSTVQETKTFDKTEYNVYTATGVAFDMDAYKQSIGKKAEEKVPVPKDLLKTETLTLYQKVKDSSDEKYYVAFSKYGKDGSDDYTLTELTNNPNGYTASLTEKDQLSYTGTPAPVYSNTVYEKLYIDSGGEKVESSAGGATVYDIVYANEKLNLYKNGDKYYTRETAGSSESYTFTPLTLYTNPADAQSLMGAIDEGGALSHMARRSDKATTVTINVEQNTVTPVLGTAVTLTAKIAAGTTTASGEVNFDIFNTTTGTSTQQWAKVADEKASIQWTPSEPGVYTITAKYFGSQTVQASLGTTTYYAYGATAEGYDLQLPDEENAVYGEDITAQMVKWTANGDKVTTSGTDGAVYQAYRFIGEVKNPADKNTIDVAGYSTTPEDWDGSGILMPGKYLIKATLSEPAAPGITLYNTLTVSKRLVTIRVPEIKSPIVADNWPENWGTLTFKGLLDADQKFEGLFMLDTSNVAKVAGNYDITVKMLMDNSALQDEFLAKYLPTYEKCVVTVTTGTAKVTYEAGANGKLQAHDLSANSNPVTSNDLVTKGHDLLFTATPSTGFSVSKWFLGDSEVTASTSDAVIGADNKTLRISNLSADIAVRVEFTNQTHTLTFSADGDNGAVTAQVMGATVQSNTKVTGGSSVTFTATPNANFVVEEWTVKQGDADAVTQKNPDGSVYTANTLTIKNISADTTVMVKFAEAESYQVTYHAVDTEGKLAAGATVTADGLTNGTAVKGANVTFTAATNAGVGVLYWQVKRGDETTFTRVADAVPTYTLYNVQADTEVRVVVNTGGATNYRLEFGVVDQNGNAVSDCGTLSATSGNVTLASGDSIAAYSKVDFTFKETDGYEVVEWNVNGSPVQSGCDKLSYTIGSLGAATTVNVVVQKKPQVTVTQPGNDQGTVDVTYMLGDKSVEPSGDGYLYTGTTVTITAKPKRGYEVAAVTVNDAPQTLDAVPESDDKTVTLENVQTDQAITASFQSIPSAEVTYSVYDVGSGANGTLSLSAVRKNISEYEVTGKPTTDNASITTEGIYRDADVTLTAQPKTGYRVQEWRVNGKKQMSTENTLTLPNVQETHTVTVTFVALGDAVTWDASNGTITSVDPQLNSGVVLAKDASVALTVTPDTGYEIQHWTVNGTPQENSASDTFTYTAADTVGANIVAVCQPVEYTVSWSGDGHGHVTADGVQGTSANIRGGTKVVFTAVPDAGYVLDGWSGVTPDDSSENTLTWTVPTGKAADTSYEISATFKPGTYQLTYAKPEYGTLQCDIASGETVSGGSSVTFTATPQNGYVVSHWLVNNSRVDSTQTQHTVTITGDTTVAVVLASSQYRITYSASGNGTVTSDRGESPAAVARGESITLTATANPYHMLQKWQVNGADVDGEDDDVVRSGNQLTLQNVSKDYEVKAVFTVSASYPVGFSVDGGGGKLTATANGAPITPSDQSTVPVPGGSKLVFTAVPDPEKMVTEWKINDRVVSGNLSNTLTIDSLTQTTDVKVSFEPYVGFEIPTDKTGYLIEKVSRTPDDTTAGEIRMGGNLTFTVNPAPEYSTISELKLGDTDLLDATPDKGISVIKNAKGGYTVTITNVQDNLTLGVTAHKLVIVENLDSYSIPEALKKNGLETTEKIVNKLNAALTAAKDGMVVWEIALKYYDGQKQLVEVSESSFPKNGVDVVLRYPDGTNSSDTFTIVHLLTAGTNAGQTEIITPQKKSNGLYFRVNSLSPFGVGWTKYVAPAGGGGGGGGGAVAEENIKLQTAANGTVTVDDKNAKQGDTVTITAAADKGYALSKVTVADKDGKPVALTEKGGGVFTFVMPKGSVTVTAVFVPNAGWSNPFRDLAQNAWYYDAVQYVVEHGLFTGTSGTTFSPESNMTRAMLVTVLYRAAGEPNMENEILGYPFADVDAESWYGTAVYWARLNGVVSGTGAETFSPNDPITREQLAVMLYRYAGSPAASGTLDSFSDAAKAGSYASDALRWAVQQSILTGKGSGILDPKGGATRAQVATMLMRFLEMNKHK